MNSLFVLAALTASAGPASAHDDPPIWALPPALETRSGGAEAYLPRLKSGPLEERIAAARTLRAYASHEDDVLDALLACLADRHEPDALRAACAAALFLSGGRPGVPEALLRVAEDSYQPERVRAASLTAMYRMTGVEDTRDRIVAILDQRRRYEPDIVRRAASWTLFLAACHENARAALIRAATDDSQDDGVQIEALKSLFDHLGPADATAAAMGVAEDRYGRHGPRVQAVAALALIQLRGRPAVRSLLQTLESRSADESVRSAARRALYGAVDREVFAFFHAAWRWPNYFAEPLHEGLGPEEE